jgi:peptidyl-prolyl cis-trans isomerase D
MLQVLRRGRRWLISGTILLVGGVFVFYLSGSGGGQGAPLGSLVELGDRRYSASDLQRFYQSEEQRFRDVLGDDFDPGRTRTYLENSAREQLINRAVLAYEAEKMGLHVGDEEVRRFLRELFRNANGTFDPETMRDYARREYGSETRFVREIRDELLVGKFQRLLNSAGMISKAEARQALRYHGDEVQIAYVSIDLSGLGDEVEISEDGIAEVLADESEHLRADYEAQRDRFNTPEEARVRHILFRVESGADEEAKAAARKKAEAVLLLVRKGGDFAALAEEHSEGPSAEKGGDLGFVVRSQSVAPFEEVAFSLEPGATSDLVETEFGIHIIRVEEKREAVEKSFDEVARELAEERLRKKRGTERARALAETLSRDVAAGESLTDAARARGLTLERPDWLSHNVNGTIEGLGSSRELLDAIFAISDAAPSSPRIFEVDERLVLVERTGHREIDDEEVAAAVDSERESILGKWRTQAQRGWIMGARQSLMDRGLLKVRFESIDGVPAT